ncbi:MAG: hypothetical protein K2H38_07085 [Muribaculaceae bacterium]|nr:hypothetical protein [Muribaculaceae bacterium]
MRYDDDRYLDDEDEKDFWDDELELSADITPRSIDEDPIYPRTSGHDYTSYDDDSDGNSHDGEAKADLSEADKAEDDNNDYYSDPEPTPQPRRQRFFSKKTEEDEDAGDDDNDYFDSDADTEPKKKPKAPKLDPEDPDYWIEEDESPLSGIMPGPTGKWKWQLGVVIAGLILIIWGWIWFFRPYSDNAVKYGYITEMERRGSLFKTFEGTMIPYKQLGDPDPLYFQPQRFSVMTDSLAAVMKRMMLGCVPVRVEYETYHTPLPWKGEERMVIIKADSADPGKILPPEYRLNNK